MTRGSAAAPAGLRAPRGAASLAACTAALCLLAADVPAAAGGDAEVFDRVVASVNDVIITESEVDLMTRVRLVREGKGALLAQPLPAAQRNATVERLVDQALAYSDARWLASEQISAADVDAQLAEFRARFPSPAAFAQFLQAHEVTEAELGERFQRVLLGYRYARYKVDRDLKVTELQLSEYLARHAGEPSLRGRPTAEARDVARAALQEQAFPAALREWLQALRKRARVRVLVVYR